MAITGTFGNDNLVGSINDDTILGYQGLDTLVGGDGNDSITGQEGASDISGGNGDDKLTGTLSNDTIDGGGDSDFISSAAGDDSIIGGDGNDTVLAASGLDIIFGGGGNDYIEGGEGNDTILGEDGDDTIIGGQGTDSLTGGLGADRFQLYIVGYNNFFEPYRVINYHKIGGSFAEVNDIITDFNRVEGDKLVISSEIYSAISTVSGTLNASDLANVNNTPGTSTAPLVFDTSTSTLYYNANGILPGFGQGGVVAQLTGITSLLNTDILVDEETLPGGAISGNDLANDTLNGNFAANLIIGKSGNNTINAGGGDDTVYAGLGNDTVDGGIGNDLIQGNEGNDSLTGGTGGDDTIGGGSGIDTIVGGIGNDALNGGDDADNVNGDSGNDIISGGNGNDSLFGGGDNDLIKGNFNDDQLSGGLGNDTLIGNQGNDTLTGGGGDDVFGFIGSPGIQNSFLSDIGLDTITDFGNGSDRLILNEGTFGELVFPNDFVVSAAPTGGETAKIVYDSTTGLLYFNENGSAAGFGNGGGFVTLTGAPALSAASFLTEADFNFAGGAQIVVA